MQEKFLAAQDVCIVARGKTGIDRRTGKTAYRSIAAGDVFPVGQG